MISLEAWTTVRHLHAQGKSIRRGSAMIRMTLANWEQFEVASKRIDPDTGQRYVRLYANARETWEKVEIAWVDNLFSPRHLDKSEYRSPVSSHR